MLTKSQLQALLFSIANSKFQSLVDWYNAVNNNDATLAATKKAEVKKWDDLRDIVNQGINQLDVIAATPSS